MSKGFFAGFEKIAKKQKDKWHHNMHVSMHPLKNLKNFSRRGVFTLLNKQLLKRQK